MTDKDKEFSGYHRFRAEDGSEYGSFEVFHEDEPCFASDNQYEPGWYWWSCFPGCMPDGEQNGPFPTSEGAYLDALEGWKKNEAGVFVKYDANEASAEGR